MFICICWLYRHIDCQSSRHHSHCCGNPKSQYLRVHCTLLSSSLSSVVRAQLFGSHIQKPPCVSVCEFPNVEMVMVWTRFSLALQLIQMQSSFAEHLTLSKLHPMLSRVLIFGILAFRYHPIFIPFLACDCYHWIGMRPYGCQVGQPHSAAIAQITISSVGLVP
jgi:hypothetical protein